MLFYTWLPPREVPLSARLGGFSFLGEVSQSPFIFIQLTLNQTFSPRCHAGYRVVLPFLLTAFAVHKGDFLQGISKLGIVVFIRLYVNREVTHVGTDHHC
jgi:hypothetical protein